MENVKSSKTKKLNPFALFIFAVILPLLVASLLAFFLLSFLGVDVVGCTEAKLTATHVVKKLVKTEDKKKLTEKLMKANNTIEHQKDKIDDVQQEVEHLQTELDKLEMEIAKLENAAKEEEMDELSAEFTTDIKKVAQSFRKMDKEQAAKIVTNLDMQHAVQLLSNV